jgi:hypothetical protein
LVLEAAGILLDEAESAAGIDEVDGVGFASSPASVIALSLLLFFPIPESAAPAPPIISLG